jgi:hypothetical protein
MRTKNFRWAQKKFTAQLLKHNWMSNQTTTHNAYYYSDIYNEIRKQSPVSSIDLEEHFVD